MAFELSGKVKVVMDPQTFNSGFTKREFVVTDDDGRYPQDICFECIQDKVSLLDNVSAGDAVKVTFDIRGREYNGRYFNNLNAWRVEVESSEATAADEDRPPLPDEAPADLDEFDDKIPF